MRVQDLKHEAFTLGEKAKLGMRLHADVAFLWPEVQTLHDHTLATLKTTSDFSLDGIRKSLASVQTYAQQVIKECNRSVSGH